MLVPFIGRRKIWRRQVGYSNNFLECIYIIEHFDLIFETVGYARDHGNTRTFARAMAIAVDNSMPTFLASSSAFRRRASRALPSAAIWMWPTSAATNLFRRLSFAFSRKQPHPSITFFSALKVSISAACRPRADNRKKIHGGIQEQSLCYINTVPEYYY